MSGKHRTAPEQNRQPSTHDFTPVTKAVIKKAAIKKAVIKKSAGAIWFPASIAMAFAGFSAAVMVAHAEPNTAAEQPTPSAYTVAEPQAVTLQATVVAVTAESITARSADGHVQTYLVTPETTAVTGDGGQSFATTAPFAVNDQVAIQATVSSGLATATAVAERSVIGQDGRPMDYL